MAHPKLIDISGKENKLNITINSNKFSFGRALDNSYVLEDLAVSRLHCIIEKCNDDWIILDKSSNGTIINNVVLTRENKRKLEDGDIIALNDNVKFKFQLPQVTVSKNELLTDEDVINVTDTIVDVVEVPEVKMDEQTEVKTKEIAESSSGKKVTDVLDDDFAEDELNCSICCDLFIEAYTLNCSHTFCKHCIEHWLKNENICPICRTPVTGKFVNRIVNNLTEKYVLKASDETKERRQNLIKERAVVTVEQTKKGKASGPRLRSGRVASNNGGPIEILSSDTDEDDDDDDYYLDDLEFSRFSDDSDYNGVPGAYYGGYGSCYSCGSRGHWANGCPNNPRRRRH